MMCAQVLCDCGCSYILYTVRNAPIYHPTSLVKIIQYYIYYAP